MSSEEKLLKVIRRQDKIRQTKDKKDRSSVDRLSSVPKGSSGWFLRFCNRMFILAAIVFGSFAGYRYSLLTQNTVTVVQGPRASSDFRSVNATSLDTFFESDSLDFEKRLGERDVFEAPWEKPQEIEDVALPKEVISVQPDLSTFMRLAGIIMQKDDSQVIIEDLRHGETFFVSKGQDILGARLVDVFEDKAVFIYNNERVELTP